MRDSSSVFILFFLHQSDGLRSAFVEKVQAAGDECGGLDDGWLQKVLVCFFHTEVRLFSAVRNPSRRGTGSVAGMPGYARIPFASDQHGLYPAVT